MKKVKAGCFSYFSIRHKVLKANTAIGELITIFGLIERHLLEAFLDLLERAAFLEFHLAASLMLHFYNYSIYLIRI